MRDKIIIRRFAILIGTSNYQEPSFHKLRCPKFDVEDLGKILKEELNFYQVTPLINKDNHTTQIVINTLLRTVNPEDLVVIYYSGHGKRNPIGKLHLIMQNSNNNSLESTSIPMEAIISYIEVSLCKKIVIVLDCCYSGLGGKFLKSTTADELDRILQESQGLYLLTSSTAHQVSKESETGRNSIFTGHIIKGLQSGEADMDEDGWYSADDIYNYTYMKMLKSLQTPLKFCPEGKGLFFLGKNRSYTPPSGTVDELYNIITSSSETEAKSILRSFVAKQKTTINEETPIAEFR